MLVQYSIQRECNLFCTSHALKLKNSRQVISPRVSIVDGVKKHQICGGEKNVAQCSSRLAGILHTAGPWLSC